MSREQKRTAIFWSLCTAVASAVLLGLGQRAYADKIDVVRFVTDSVHRDAVEDAHMLILRRIDRRDSTMFCSSLPKDKQAGCQ